MEINPCSFTFYFKNFLQMYEKSKVLLRGGGQSIFKNKRFP